MFNFREEKNVFQQGFKILGSLDEVGRGPLAGPVVAACVTCNESFKVTKEIRKINDSKKMTERGRERFFKIIYESFNEVGIGICDHKTIDRINILQASFLAMKQAIGQVKNKPDFILLDGKLLLPNISLKQTAVIKGDSFIISIAAASIIAKVTRDNIMKEMHQKYPNYGFDQHKGYGTKMHLEALKKYGPCPIHRKSFAPVANLLKV